MTDDALQDMASGFATCTGLYADSQAYGAGGMYDGYLAYVVRATASDCGLPSALSPLSLSTCMGALPGTGGRWRAEGYNTIRAREGLERLLPWLVARSRYVTADVREATVALVVLPTAALSRNALSPTL